ATELMARLRQGESWSSEFLVRRRDGATFLAQVSDSPIYDADGRLIGIIGLSSDISARKRADQRRTVQYAVSQVLAEPVTRGEAAPRLLQAIGEGLEWAYGALWTVDQRANVLACVATWHTPARAFAAFEASTRQRTFAPGVGLPGRVWGQCEP